MISQQVLQIQLHELKGTAIAVNALRFMRSQKNKRKHTAKLFINLDLQFFFFANNRTRRNESE